MKLLLTLLLISTALSILNCNTERAFENLPDFRQAEEILIEDDWTGLSPVAPIKRHYVLNRSENGFTGKAHFSFGGARRQARNAKEDVEIPISVVQSFLEKLMQIDFREGDYEPNLQRTDDYPSIKIQLRVKGENVVIFSKSQGDEHTPWGMTYKGKTYVSDSNSPARALKELAPYLKQEIFKELIKQE